MGPGFRRDDSIDEVSARRDGEHGFTLIEVLVALVATGFLLAIVMNGALLARERSVKAAGTSEAVLLARHLAAQGTARPYTPGEAQGTQGALAWRMAERPLATDPRGLWVLAGIEVQVADRRGARLFAGETRRLKRVRTS